MHFVAKHEIFHYLTWACKATPATRTQLNQTILDLKYVNVKWANSLGRYKEGWDIGLFITLVPKVLTV